MRGSAARVERKGEEGPTEWAPLPYTAIHHDSRHWRSGDFENGAVAKVEGLNKAHEVASEPHAPEHREEPRMSQAGKGLREVER